MMSGDALEVHLSPEDLERLRRLARASGKSDDQLVGEGLRSLEEQGTYRYEPTPEERREAIEALIKMAEGQTYVKERVRGGKW